eukprot:comp5880_c0_seq1/m.1737 comp5880_c0_seq1/g.1737  ORF comp5880_c0_seq1/g.1737 comp5880_c0_seq1/m.1737 type:complete len:457 (-) comp5880_c0_seq1:416-1786(-)
MEPNASDRHNKKASKKKKKKHKKTCQKESHKKDRRSKHAKYLSSDSDSSSGPSYRSSGRSRSKKEEKGSGVSALHEAAELGSVAGVENAWAQDPTLAVDALDAKGWTCLHHAARWGHYNLARLLITRGANVNAQTAKDKETPLHLAILFQQRETVSLLLGNHADTEIQSNDGLTPSVLLKMAGLGATRVEESCKRAEDLEFDEDRDLKANREEENRRARVDDEKAWREKLFAQADSEVDDSFVYSFSEEGRTSKAKTDEEWRQSMWRQMYHKRRPATPPPPPPNRPGAKRMRGSLPLGPGVHGEDEEARRRSEQTIKEELEREVKRREERRRERRLKARTTYEEKWTSFSTRVSELRNVTSGPLVFLSHGDIPWPSTNTDAEEVKGVLFADIDFSDQDLLKARIRQETLRWHPDKFAQMMGALLLEDDKGRVLDRVKAIAQVLNSVRTGDKPAGAT